MLNFLTSSTSKQDSSGVHIPTNGFEHYVSTQLKIDAVNKGKSIIVKTLNVEADITVFTEFMRKQGIVSEHSRGGDAALLIDVVRMCVVEYTVADRTISINILGIPETVAYYEALISASFYPPICYIKWIYDAQYLESMVIPVSGKNTPFTEMYPFLSDSSETLEEYYDRFIASDSCILLLIGPPGTGKTSFLRGLLMHTKQNAILTYHNKLLEKDEFFASWLRKDSDNILIIEDSDTMLAARTEGNDMMHRFLNLGDGLITIPGKKMIFTTNLSSTDSIDPALTRPGRCHDILNFGALTREQADVVAKRGGTAIVNDQKEYTIAEIFSGIKTRKDPVFSNKRRLGFT